MQSLLLGTHRASAPRTPDGQPLDPQAPHSHLQTIIQTPDRRWPLPTASHHEPMLMSPELRGLRSRLLAGQETESPKISRTCTCSYKPARASSPQEATFPPASHATVFRREAQESPSCFPPSPRGGSASMASSQQNACHPAS